MLPSSAELEYFIEVSHSLNLSRASERLGISQPSLSLAIKRLEQTMGTALFIRHKHGVTLTPAGKQLLLHVRQLLQQWENTKSNALASQEEIQGRITLGCNSIIAIYMVSQFLAPLLENNPRLEIQFEHELSQKITEQVINLNIDMGIVINPVRHPDLIIQKIGVDETGFWVGPGNRKIQNVQSDNAVLICNPEALQTQSLLAQCKKKDIKFSRFITSKSMEVVAKLCAEGAGIGVLPTKVAEALYPGKLKPLSKFPIHSDEQCLIYRSESRDIKAVQVIAKAIKDFQKA